MVLVDDRSTLWYHRKQIYVSDKPEGIRRASYQKLNRPIRVKMAGRMSTDFLNKGDIVAWIGCKVTKNIRFISISSTIFGWGISWNCILS